MSLDSETPREIVEVEAVPLEEGEREGGEDSSWTQSGTAQRLRKGLSPVIAGIIIDGVDVSLGNPALGFPVGVIAGFILAKHLGFRLWGRVGVALACGVYCMSAPLRFFPLATIIGVFANISLSEKPDSGS